MTAKGKSETDDVDDHNDSGRLFLGILTIPRGAKTNIRRETSDFFRRFFILAVENKV